ncbi:MAG: class I SAM-dependent methyltransferase, partial [Candidatus Sumerlaeia bacterium]|nr:class I SAM-dependent methyltransferase [Candidatus Sumerlaeia bacterium]
MHGQLPLQCARCLTPFAESDFELSFPDGTYNALALNHHHAKEVPCRACGLGLKVRAGMLLQLQGTPPYYDPTTEFNLAVEILQWSETMDFNGVLNTFIRERTHVHAPDDMKWLAIGNRLDAVNRGARMLGELEEMSDRVGYIPPNDQERDLGVLLDFGCGVAGQLIAASGRATQLIGVDSALTELALARRNLLDHGCEGNVRLIQVEGEELPLKRCSVDTIILRDTIEHFQDQRVALSRAWRALKPGGRLILNSPNRYMLWWLEPHVSLWGMGFMPRAWMSP